MSELSEFINSSHERDLKLTDSLARIAQAQLDMNVRLFGGDGQKGAIPYMIEQAKEHADKVDKDMESVRVRVGKLETWRTGTKRWIAGAVAVLALEGTALGLYFSKISSHISSK